MAERGSSSESAQPVTTSSASTVPLSLSSATTTTPSSPAVVGMRRKSQGLTVSRANRRGTGPVLPEDIHAAVSVRQTSTDTGSNTAASARAGSEPVAPPRSSGSVTSVFSRPSAASTPAGRGASVNAVEPTSAVNAVYTINARPAEMNLNYKALYEKEKLECERLRKEVEELKRLNEHSSSVASIRTTPSRFRIGSPAGGPTPIAKSASGNSIDDAERRTLERKIADLEIQLKELDDLTAANLQLRAENAAMMRVLAKLSLPTSRLDRNQSESE
ncbi:unnamed protein product [Heligmosomoides polygyrus]|uniref:PRKG1_interact domain-containing protein n=1 Tax=Heligmosomoides polygyrus TaxID=6339 RepID=A0A183GPD9_HELPZ|nr:unnamed protein product [Heligmosomoides polygyrus]